TDLWPQNGSYHWSLAQALRRAGRLQEAEQETRLADQYLNDEREQKRLAQRIRDHPGDVALYQELAALHLAHGRPERAAQILRDALAIDPGSERLQALLREAEQSASTRGAGR